MGTSQVPEARLRIIAENLARAALQELRGDVEGTGQAAQTASTPFANLVRHFDQGNRTGQLLRNGLQQLSFQAANIPGPLGKAGAAILGLGVSGGPILVATAALGAFALAWKKADEAGERAAANAESAGARLRKTFASALGGGNVEEFGERLDLFRDRLAQARADLERLEATPLPAQRFRQEVTPQGLTVSVPLNDPVQERADQLAAATNVVNQTQALLAQAEGQARDAAEKTTAALERQADVLSATIGIRRRAIDTGQDEASTLIDIAAATARVQAETMGLDAAHTAALVNANIRLQRLKEENRVLEAQRDLLDDLAKISADVSGFFAQPFQQEILAQIKVPRLEDLLGEERTRQAGIDVTALEKQGGQAAFELFNSAEFQGQMQMMSTEIDNFIRIQERSAQILQGLLTPQQQFNDAMAVLSQSIQWATMTTEERTDAENRLREAMGLTAQQAKISAAQMVTAFAGLAALAASGGEAGGFISGIGGVVGLFNPLAGALVAGFGQIVSAADRNHRESLDALHRIVENTTQRGRPENIGLHVYIDGEEIIDRVDYAIGRRERTNGRQIRPPR